MNKNSPPPLQGLKKIPGSIKQPLPLYAPSVIITSQDAARIPLWLPSLCSFYDLYLAVHIKDPIMAAKSVFLL